VAVLRKTSSPREGTRPNQDWNRVRWPEEETGINSVTAWVRERTKREREVMCKINRGRRSFAMLRMTIPN